MKKLLMLVLVMTINGGNLADIGEVADCGRFTSSYQELAPAPTTDSVAPYLTPDATPWPAKDNIPEAPSETADNQPSHDDAPAPAVPINEPAETPHPAPDNTPEAPSEIADNQPSHNEPVETPHSALDNTPEAPSWTADNTPAHSDARESNNCPEAPASVAEVMANDASNVNTHCDMPTE